MTEPPLPCSLMKIVQEYAIVGDVELNPGLSLHNANFPLLFRNPHPAAIAICLERFRDLHDDDAPDSPDSWKGISRIPNPILVKHCLDHPQYMDMGEFCKNTHPNAVKYCLANPELIVMKEFCRNVSPCAVKYCLDHPERICFLSFCKNNHPDAVKYCIERGYKDWGCWINMAFSDGCSGKDQERVVFSPSTCGVWGNPSIFNSSSLMNLYK